MPIICIEILNKTQKIKS